MIGRNLMMAVAAAAIAGLLFGFDTVVISGVTGALTRLYGLSPGWLGFTVSAALWGTLGGAALGALFGARIGSRDGLRIAALFYVISGVGCALAWSWAALVVFRILCGVAIGASSVLAPVYLAEIAPARQRGLLVGMFQVNIVVGIVAAYVSNYLVGTLELGADEWRWKLGVTAVPAIVFFLMMLPVPNSPRWLASKGRVDEARRAHTALHAEREPVDDIFVFDPGGKSSVSLAELWRNAKRPILLAAGLGALNQLTGINAILYYLNDIFAAAGFGRVSSDVQSIAIGLTNLTFTLIAMAVIDRLGRRAMLLIGSVGMATMLGVAALVMFGQLPQTWLLGVLVLFMASFAFSQGAVIWVYISEIFPTRYRSAGQGIGSGTIWLFDALVAQLYPIAAAQSKGAPFVFFMAVMVLQGFLVWRFFPETKGVSLEELGARMSTVAA